MGGGEKSFFLKSNTFDISFKHPVDFLGSNKLKGKQNYGPMIFWDQKIFLSQQNSGIKIDVKNYEF